MEIMGSTQTSHPMTSSISCYRRSLDVIQKLFPIFWMFGELDNLKSITNTKMFKLVNEYFTLILSVTKVDHER